MVNITVFGSCRVYTPSKILHDTGAVSLCQGNIFGYTHYTHEIIQQIDFICGKKELPRRLRSYLNIPESWEYPAERRLLNEIFNKTDSYIIEVSSVRVLRFKALYLQINRVRELLVRDDSTLKRWWNPLVRTGLNDPTMRPPLEGTAREVAEGLAVSEQSAEEVARDVHRLISALQKPTLVVSHFNRGYDGRAIDQRTTLVEGVKAGVEKAVREGASARFYNPTTLIDSYGLDTAIKDLGHYREEFEPVVAKKLLEEIETLMVS